MFGGRNGSTTRIQDVWVFDGVDWHVLNASGGPSARDGVGVAVDPVTGKLLCVQGRTHEVPSPQVYSDETWWLDPLQGSYDTYRLSCPSSNGSPALTNVTLPRVGQALQLRVTGMGGSKVGFLLFGFQDATWGVNALPLEMTAFGAAGCYINVDALVHFVSVTDPQGSAQPVLPIPNESSLVAVEFYNQFITMDDGPPGRALRITTTNAGRGVIGF